MNDLQVNELKLHKLQCGWCGTPLTKQSQFGHRVAKVEMGFVSVRIDYDLDCFSCGRQTTVRLHLVSPLHVKGDRFSSPLRST